MFYEKSNGLYGRASKCKSCFRVYAKKYKTNNQEKIQDYQKKWNDNNKFYPKKYYYANRKKVIGRHKGYQQIQCDGLGKNYILTQLRLKVNECPAGLIELKRQQLKLFRETHN